MNFFRINISESYIFRTVEPITFDKFLLQFIPLAIEHKISISSLVSAMINSHLFELEHFLNQIHMEDIKLMSIPNAINIKFFAKERRLILINEQYEFLYDFATKYLTIVNHMDGYNIYNKLQNVNTLKTIIEYAKKLMVGLCSKDINNIDNSKQTLYSIIGNKIKKNKDDKIILPTSEKLETIKDNAILFNQSINIAKDLINPIDNILTEVINESTESDCINEVAIESPSA